MATDDDLAEQLAGMPDTDRKKAWARAHRDYTPEVEMLSAVYDRIGELIRVTAAARGGRGKPPPPAPRPASAFERVRARLRREKHDSLVARMVRRSAG